MPDMRPDDERARIKETERGKQAAAILASDLWDEAYRTLVDAELSRLLAPGTDDDDTLESKRRIHALDSMKRALVEYIETGELAEQQLEARDG